MDESLPLTVLSHYRVLGRLGSGGMGEVYLGEDTRLGRKVAIKVLPAAFTKDAERLRRFLQEARAASALNHPNIITVHDIGDSEAGRFLVMEHVEGQTLREAVRAGNPLDVLTRLGGQMARGLAAAHAAGIVHRDIKPDNIMIRADGYVKILDFGLARLAGGPATQGGGSESSTEPGMLMGTLKYMSPEQVQGHIAGPESDVYSLGMVFFEMASGHYPIAAQTFLGMLNAIVTQVPGRPAQWNPQVPPELDGLICRMLEKDPARRPSAAEVATVLDGRPAAAEPVAIAPAVMAERHVVGRKREHQEFRAALQSVRAGRGTILCVTGEPGIGKSTLVDEVLAGLAAEGGCTIAKGRCSERLAGTEAYLPLLGALESLLQGGSTSPAGQAMKQLAPTWFIQVSPGSGMDGDSARMLAELAAASQDRLKRELSLFLQEVARIRPLLLFLDDLHWADVSTIDILTYLASQFSGLRLLIVVTYRPSDMLLGKHPFLQIKPDLQARGLLRELPLAFLTEADIAQYLELEFPGHRFPAGFPRLIQSKTEGSPLFMADLVRYLRDRAVVARQGGEGPWVLDRALPEIERELPESVRGMIERKIAQLSEEDRRLLTVASVQGYEFDSAVLAHVLQIDADTAEERLETLERVYAFVRLVREAEFPNRSITLRYRFVHVLYQNALYTAVRATRRSTLSREVAEALEGFHGSKSSLAANELALLWEAARDYTKAGGYFALAARQAGKVFADQEAAVLARRGLAAFEQTPESQERTDQELVLLVVLGVALRAVKGFADPEVGEAFARARELCPASGQSSRMVPVLRGLWEFYEVRADYANALPYAEQLLALARQLQDPALLVVGCDVMGDTSVWLGEFATAWKHLDLGVRLYDPQMHRSHLFVYGYDTGMACHSYGAVALWHLGHTDQALQHLQKCNAIARELAHPMTSAFAGIMAAWLHRLRGEMADAQREAEYAVAVSKEHGLPFFLGFGMITRGWALAALGRVEEAITEILEGLEIYRATGSELGVSLWLGCLAEAYARAGRSYEALEVLDQALDFAARTGERVYEPELLRWKAMLTMDRAMDQAVSHLEAALAAARRQSARSLELRAAVTLGGLLVRMGRATAARSLVAPIYGSFTEGLHSPDLREASAFLASLP